jgi:bacillithiol biosynthesis cysteine-adding enzyme BshC
MEVGDNDYKEINHVNYLNVQNELVSLSLPENPQDGRSIYLRDIPGDIEELLNNAEQLFPPNEFRDELLRDLKLIYSSGKPFSDAFAEWVHYLFRDFGLIVIDPTDEEFANLSIPLFKKAITDHKVIQESVQINSRDLQKAGYNPQVTLSAQQTLVFYRLENNNRARIDFEGQKFIIHPSDSHESFSQEPLLNEIEKAPSRFTPNVLFRPLVQDWLLPTAVYIGGPGEISYAAQLKKIYEIFGIVPPCFIPRMRLTLLEEKIQRTIDKLQIDVTDIFFNSDKIIDNHVKKHSDPRIEDTLKEIHQHMEEKMDKLGKLLIETDATLESSVSKTSQNISDLLHRLENKANSAYERRMQTEINQIKKIQTNLQPNKIPQERLLNIYQYLFKYGPELITGLYKTVNIETRDHQIIYF